MAIGREKRGGIYRPIGRLRSAEGAVRLVMLQIEIKENPLARLLRGPLSMRRS